jgi:hypothetical protein
MRLCALCDVSFDMNLGKNQSRHLSTAAFAPIHIAMATDFTL